MMTPLVTVYATVISTLLLMTMADDHNRLLTLEREILWWRLEDRPAYASDFGIYRFSDRLEEYGLEHMAVRYEVGQNYLQKLGDINKDNLSKRDQVDLAILKDMLQTFVQGFHWWKWNYLTPMTWLEGQQRDPYFVVATTPFDNRGDFENYISRLNTMPRLFDQYTTLFKEAIRLNRTAHYVTMSRVPDQIGYITEVQLEDSVYFSPFLTDLNFDHFKKTIPNGERQEIIVRGKKATAKVFQAYRRLRKFISEVYLKNTRPQIGVGSLEDGKNYYKACLKWYLSFDMDPEDIHQKGMKEVERVKKEMFKIMERQGFKGYKIRDYFVELKNRTDMFFDTDEELIAEYERIIADVIDPTLSGFFHDPPGLPIIVEKMRFDGPRGQYSPGTPDGIRPGVFFINTFRKRPKYVMLSLTMHEANPGHHLQMSYASTADLHDFRKYKEFSDKTRVPFAFPSYTAYVEGWGLYAESLGTEMGIYKDDYDIMGYLEAEMWRACRMVADTGIHYLGWDKEKVVDFILEHTSESKEGIEVEVDRYITWPGQAVTYKIGELKIKELRRYAEKTLGPKHFDIRDFHKVVLENGGMPLNLLSTIVREWVDNFQKNRDDMDEEDKDCECTQKPSGAKSRCSRSLRNKNAKNANNSASRMEVSWRNNIVIAFALCVVLPCLRHNMMLFSDVLNYCL